MATLACRGLQSAMAGLGGTGPPVTVRLEVIGDYSKDELAAAEAAAQAPSEPCRHRQSAADGSLPARGSQGALHAACTAHEASPENVSEGFLAPYGMSSTDRVYWRHACAACYASSCLGGMRH